MMRSACHHQRKAATTATILSITVYLPERRERGRGQSDQACAASFDKCYRHINSRLLITSSFFVVLLLVASLELSGAFPAEEQTSFEAANLDAVFSGLA